MNPFPLRIWRIFQPVKEPLKNRKIQNTKENMIESIYRYPAIIVHIYSLVFEILKLGIHNIMRKWRQYFDTGEKHTKLKLISVMKSKKFYTDF